MMTNQPDQFSSFSSLLRAALDDLLVPDAETFLDMVADDIVMEFPYAPPAVTAPALHPGSQIVRIRCVLIEQIRTVMRRH